MYRIVHDRMMKIWLYPDCLFKLTNGYVEQCKGQKIIQGFTEKVKILRIFEKNINYKNIISTLYMLLHTVYRCQEKRSLRLENRDR